MKTYFNRQTSPMTLPTISITQEVFREAMPPYQLSADLLEAMFSAVRAPPPEATMAWRQVRAAWLVQEVAGLMPADAPQARIAAEIVIMREATDDALARAIKPGVTLEQASGCGGSRPAWRFRPPLGSARWCGTSRSRCRFSAPYWRTGSILPRSPPSGGMARGRDGRMRRRWVGVRRRMGRWRWQAGGTRAGGQAMTKERAAAMEPGSAMPEDSGPDDGATSGVDGEFTDGSDPLAMVRATCGAVTRLNRGPGWTLDVVRPRMASDVVGGEVGGGDVVGGDVVRGDRAIVAAP
jgi:hypothetical protein